MPHTPCSQRVVVITVDHDLLQLVDDTLGVEVHLLGRRGGPTPPEQG